MRSNHIPRCIMTCGTSERFQDADYLWGFEVRSGSFSSDRPAPDVRGMSAVPPIATELVTRDRSHKPTYAVPQIYSITSSARSRIAVGSSMPIALAVFRFTTISNFVGCSIGKSAGLAPRAIRSTNSATRPKSAVMLGP
jgi:hypothetical protein